MFRAIRRLRLLHHGRSPYLSEIVSPLTSELDAAKPFHPGTAHCHRGDGEIRTHDPLLARQVLSQLSYTPITDLLVC